MPKSSQSALPAYMKVSSPARWTKEVAAREFNINPRTLANRITTFAIEPGNDGMFSTKQICDAVFSDIDAEKLRLTREQADKLELENETSRGNLIHVEELVQRLGKFLSAAKLRIYSNQKLENEEKDKLVGMLAACLNSVDGTEVIPGSNPDAASEI